ncbi:MAG: hypothetical protein ACLVDB_01230 [Anaeromassilibacillus sp.]
MTSYDTMASALHETGLYALSGETLVDAELAAYAAALDVLYERLEVLQKDSFLYSGEEGFPAGRRFSACRYRVPWKNGERRCCSTALSIAIRIPAAIFKIVGIG